MLMLAAAPTLHVHRSHSHLEHDLLLVRDLLGCPEHIIDDLLMVNPLWDPETKVFGPISVVGGICFWDAAEIEPKRQPRRQVFAGAVVRRSGTNRRRPR